MASRPLTPVSNDLAISCRNSSEDYPPETSERECHLSPSQSVESDFAYYEYSIWNEHSAKIIALPMYGVSELQQAKPNWPILDRKKQPASSNLLDYFNDLLRALPGSRRKPVDADPAVPPNESPTTASSSAAIAIKRSDFFDQTSAFARELSPTGLRRPGSLSYTTHRRRSHRISFYNRSVRSSRYGAEENASAAAENFSETESKLDLESIATGTEVDGGDRELDRTPSESDMPDDTQSIEDDDQGVLDSDHDGWKSFIEWRNGIERLGQPNEVESPPSISETESKTSEDLNISDNDGVSLYTVRGVKGDAGVAPNLLPGAISEPEVGSRNDETNLPLVLFNLEGWLQSLSPRGFEFYPPKKSLPLVSLSENIVPSHNFGIVRQRSRSETRGKILPAFWEGVPLSFFKNGVYLAITGTSHVNSAKSLDPTSILSAIGRRLEYTSYTVTLKVSLSLNSFLIAHHVFRS
ncbi:hypothetical protein BDR26DRAFT_962482 [Obelidium mucronatum]|nr:hypothetical protein BDR26DRAFT_962482 [Obelidium mucronatum]